MLTHSTVECLAVKIIKSESHRFCDEVCKLIKAYCIIHCWKELLFNSVAIVQKVKKGQKRKTISKETEFLFLCIA